MSLKMLNNRKMTYVQETRISDDSKTDHMFKIDPVQSWREALEWDRLSFSPLLAESLDSASASASSHSLRSLFVSFEPDLL